MEHPDDSILLAYTREQSLDEGRSSVHQHIDVCKKCYQRCMEYAQISTELSETLEHFQRNQDYRPLVDSIIEFIDSPDAMRLARRRREEERRKRYPARSRLSFVFLRPVLAPLGVLLLLVVLVAIVLAHPAGWSYFDPYILHQGQNGTVIPSVATVAAHPSLSPTRQPPGAVSATATANGGPTIRVCTTNADKAQSRIRWCGANFAPGAEVHLVVHLASGDARTRHPVPVDAQGRFQDYWVVANCKDVPVAIDVQDETGSAVAAWELRGSHQLGRCSVPNPMSIVWGP